MNIKIQCSECWNEFDIKEANLGKNVECPKCYNIFQAKFEDDMLPETQIQYTKNQIFKPNFKSFMTLSQTTPTFLLWFFGIMFLAGVVGSAFQTELVWILIVWIVWFLISLWLLKVIYNKERYEIRDKNIIYWYWALFHDNEIQLNIDKIVQVRVILGFFQYNIFGTWDINIKSAWSWTTNITIQNVNNPLQVYNLIQASMRENWFHLSKEKLVQETAPHRLGVLIDVTLRYLGWVGFWIFVLFDIVKKIIEDFGYTVLVLWILVLVAIPVILTYLDLKRRYYRVYTDAVFFSDWFLTRRYSFIPFENVSDTDNQQNFLEKIFGIHDVRVSSQWSNNDVIFKNMLYWETMMENINYLKDKTILSTNSQKQDSTQQTNQPTPQDTKTQKDDLIGYQNTQEEALDYDPEFKDSFKMSLTKNIILILPTVIFLPLFLILLVYKVIAVSFTRFYVKESSLESQFSFLVNNHAVFSIDKITKVTFRETIIDKMLGTCSIDFNSIWAWNNITFAHIKKTPDLFENIEKKLGIKNENLMKEFEFKFSITDYIKSDIMLFLYFIIWASILGIIWFIVSPIVWTNILIWALALAAIIIVWKIIYLSYYYSPGWYSHKMFADTICSHEWIIIQEKKHSLKRYIKWIKTTKYPLTNTGSIYINIAGEQIVNTWQWWKVSISNYIQIDFVQNVFDYVDQVDSLLSNTPLDKSILKEDKPCLSNTLVPAGIFVGVIVLLIFFATNIELTWFDGIFDNITNNLIWFIALLIGVAFLGILAWYIKVQFFRLEWSRAIHRYWIIYKTYHSIRYERIDFVESYQGFWNKVFGNGNVFVYTLGSSATEMKISDIEDYQNFYQKLKLEENQ